MPCNPKSYIMIYSIFRIKGLLFTSKFAFIYIYHAPVIFTFKNKLSGAPIQHRIVFFSEFFFDVISLRTIK